MHCWGEYRAVAGDITAVHHCNTVRTLNVIFRALNVIFRTLNVIFRALNVIFRALNVIFRTLSICVLQNSGRFYRDFFTVLIATMVHITLLCWIEEHSILKVN